jgi:hypothetical protein
MTLAMGFRLWAAWNPENNRNGLEKVLANLWSRKKITKRPTLVVG